MKEPKKAVKSSASRNGKKKTVPLSQHDNTPGVNFPIIGMGASAGGLEAFEQFFKAMPVHEAEDNTKIQPNHVYIIPPGKDMAIFHSALHLSVPEHVRGLRLPIDAFFRSLAEDQGERAICVILSGSGSDGTLGLRAIHGVGGVSFVQEPTTAKYDGMPSSAVQSGLATYVMPVEKITEQLVAFWLFHGRFLISPVSLSARTANRASERDAR